LRRNEVILLILLNRPDTEEEGACPLQPLFCR